MRSLLRLLAYYRRAPLLFAGLVLLSLGAVFAETYLLYVLSFILDGLKAVFDLPAAQRATAGWALIRRPCLLYVATGLSMVVLRFLRGVASSGLSMRLLSILRVQIYDRVVEQTFRFHDANKAGALITRVTRDVDRARYFFAQAAFYFLEIASIVGFSFLMVWRFHPYLAVSMVSMVPVILGILSMFAPQLGKRFKRTGDSYDRVTAAVQENVAGVRVVRAFAKEPSEEERFRSRTKAFTKKWVTSVLYWANRIPIAWAFFGFAHPLVMAVGAYLLDTGVTIGQIASCFFYVGLLYGRFWMMNPTIANSMEAAASGERIFEVLDRPLVIRTPRHPLPFPAGPGEVRFENVTFRYGRKREALRNVSLTIRGGETVGVVGSTAGGKSSLALLIPRFYDPQAGRVLVDGTDVREIRLEELRAKAIVVFQEPFLFSLSVAENIAFGRPDATRREIELSARLAGAHEFIAKLENGYDTVVGERGVNLSGGEKQRLAIARAYLADPRILVLDDSTSSVDAETEHEMQRGAMRVAKGRTTLIIAQRVSTVLHADRIVVIEKGRVVEQGTHRELIGQTGLYRKLYDSQYLEDAV